MNVPLIVTGSVAPNYDNNPMYQTIKIGADGKAKDLVRNAFQMQYFLLFKNKKVWS